MKHIAVLVPDGAFIGGIECARFAFTEANRFLVAKGKEPLFNVKIVGVKREMPVNSGIYKVYVDELISEIDKTDLAIIPALSEDMANNIENNQELIEWIVQQYGKGAEIASLLRWRVYPGVYWIGDW